MVIVLCALLPCKILLQNKELAIYLTCDRQKLFLHLFMLLYADYL